MQNEFTSLEKNSAPPEPWWLMPLIDGLLVFAAFGLAYFVRYRLQLLLPVLEYNNVDFAPYLPYALIYATSLFLHYRGSRLYRTVRGRTWLEEVYIIINGVTASTVIMMAISFFLQPLVFSRLLLIYVAAITIVLLAAARVVRRVIQANLRARGIGVQRVIIVGVGEIGQSVLRTMIARRELGYYPLGYVDDNPDIGNQDMGRLRGLGTIDNLEDAIREHKADLVVITLPWSQHTRILELVEISRRAGADVRVVPDVFQLNLRQVQIENLDGIPLLGVNGQYALKGANRIIKRSVDLAVIILTAPLWLVIFALTALAIWLEGHGPIFYRQRRVGENGQEFEIIKFRSMIPDADSLKEQLVQTHELDPRHPKIPNDPRITRVGRIIRALSIDELPQLFNVLRGQMSLVGPRPPTPDEVRLYKPWHMRRLNTLPGMTGLWQVNGRSNVPFDEMCLLDIYYIENWSVRLDAQILMLTVPRVLLRSGAY